MGAIYRNALGKDQTPNGWVFVYNLSGCGFESCCSHLIAIVCNPAETIQWNKKCNFFSLINSQMKYPFLKLLYNIVNFNYYSHGIYEYVTKYAYLDNERSLDKKVSAILPSLHNKASFNKNKQKLITTAIKFRQETKFEQKVGFSTTK